MTATGAYRIEDVLVTLQTLTLKRGDILAVLTPDKLQVWARDYIAEQMSRVIPDGVKVIILDSGLTLARVTVEDDGASG